MKVFIIFSYIFLCSCGQIGPDIDPELKPVVVDFMERTGVSYSKYYEIEYIKVGRIANKGVWGTCERYLNKEPIQVVISDKAPIEYKELILVHELGHCFLGLDHVEDEFNIMNPHGVNLAYYEVNKNRLIQKMIRK